MSNMRPSRLGQSNLFGDPAGLFLGGRPYNVNTLLSAFWYPSSPPANIFVSKTGSDAAAGTKNNPFLTINKAASVVNPGDVVEVDDGIWTDEHHVLGTPSIVEVGRGGTLGNPVIFRSKNYLGAKLDGGDGVANQGFNFRSGAGYVTIQGFEIYGMASTTGSCAGIDTFSGSDGIIIRLNSIRHCGRICISHGFGQNGIYVGVNNLIIERNIIFDIGRLSPAEGCPSAQFYTSNDHGIYHNGGNNLIVRNNLFYNNVHGWSIQEYPTARSTTRILNNTFMFGNPSFGYSHLVLDTTFNGTNLLANNLFYDLVAGYPLKVTSFAGTMTLQNNMTTHPAWTDVATPGGMTILAGNSLSTQPLLVQPPIDARLQNNSPAINAGVVLADVLEDFYGQLRASAYDIGAVKH